MYRRLIHKFISICANLLSWINRHLIPANSTLVHDLTLNNLQSPVIGAALKLHSPFFWDPHLFSLEAAVV